MGVTNMLCSIGRNRRRRPPPVRRPPNGKGRMVRWVCVFLCIVVFCMVLFQWKIRPLLVVAAEKAVSNLVVSVIDKAVLEEISQDAISYDDLIQFEKDDAGNITALKNNMTGLTQVKYRLISRLMEKLSDLTTVELGIPLGNLTNSVLLSGLGPKIPVRIVSIGTVKSGFDNSFHSAAINQTIHKVLFHVSVEVGILIPGGVTTTTVEGTVHVAETVIVGTVPDSYTYFSQFDSLKEASEAYFDYGSGLEE
jgi:sporulation protein YunB